LIDLLGLQILKVAKGGKKRSERFAASDGTQSSQKSGPFGKVSRKTSKGFQDIA
jgi:hypothetical protein